MVEKSPHINSELFLRASGCELGFEGWRVAAKAVSKMKGPSTETLRPTEASQLGSRNMSSQA